MKLTRRGLLGWLGALTGAAAVTKVAPAAAETEAVERTFAVGDRVRASLLADRSIAGRAGVVTAAYDLAEMADVDFGDVHTAVHYRFLESAAKLLTGASLSVVGLADEHEDG